jgi:hypothetical protein
MIINNSVESALKREKHYGSGVRHEIRFRAIKTAEHEPYHHNSSQENPRHRSHPPLVMCPHNVDGNGRQPHAELN